MGAGQHAFAHFLGHKESALYIGVKDEVEILRADVLQPLRGADTRVVNQNVDGADLGLGMRHGRLDRRVVGHVQLDHMGVTAFAIDKSAQLFELLHPAARQHHRGARQRQGFCKLRAQAATGAGDKCDPTRQIDAVCHR